MSERDGSAKRWAELLADWAIPDDLVASADASPYFFDPAVFADAARSALERTDDTPSDRVAREALSFDGTVLDVGAGAGAASLRLGARHVVAVDPSSELLRVFQQLALDQGVEPTIVQGSWPDVAPSVPMADVVVCHHVVYNVAGLADFASALTAHARRRVVVELTAVHPMTWMTPYWEGMHRRSQPSGPTAADAIAVLEALDLRVRYSRWIRPVQMIGETGADSIARVARRLCLPDARLGELRQLMHDVPPPVEREVVTLWWDR